MQGQKLKVHSWAIPNDVDKGIFLTTGHFTSSAKLEASKPGTKHIELIDGVEICNLLKELSLGVKIEELVTIDEDWFEQFN